MVGDIETGNDIIEGGSVKGIKEGTQDRALGYPKGSEKASEKLLPILTFCLQFERWDWIHSTQCHQPQSLKQLKRMLWSIVLKTSERSNNVDATALPESIKAAMSFQGCCF